ncbi:MAG: hypothetical protein GXP22_00030 [Gammaproteobacteria bacterium]|nr:hypothetical protein [Gammaproteobacteria bacterium]
MSKKIMLLPASNSKDIRLLLIPDDYEEHEAYRTVTGLIAKVEEEYPDSGWEELADTLEDHGFIPQQFILGPEPT